MNGKWYNHFFLFFGLLGFVFSLTILYFAMRAVMDVGGYCAEGGPYQIEVHCPDGVAWMTPLSVLGLFVFGIMYFLNITAISINFGYLFWTALFGALGWNFLDYGLVKNETTVWGWLICGIVFWLMAFGPFLLLIVIADEIPFTLKSIMKGGLLKILITTLQIVAVGLGIWLAWLVFY